MAVIRKSDTQFTPAIMFRMTSKTSNMGKLSTLSGSVVDIAHWVIYEDVDNNSGEVKKILAICTPENEVYATNSKTLIQGFEAIQDAYEMTGERWNMKLAIKEGLTKRNRTFYMCDPVD